MDHWSILHYQMHILFLYISNTFIYEMELASAKLAKDIVQNVELCGHGELEVPQGGRSRHPPT